MTVCENTSQGAWLGVDTPIRCVPGGLLRSIVLTLLLAGQRLPIWGYKGIDLIHTFGVCLVYAHRLPNPATGGTQASPLLAHTCLSACHLHAQRRAHSFMRRRFGNCMPACTHAKHYAPGTWLVVPRLVGRRTQSPSPLGLLLRARGAGMCVPNACAPRADGVAWLCKPPQGLPTPMISYRCQHRL